MLYRFFCYLICSLLCLSFLSCRTSAGSDDSSIKIIKKERIDLIKEVITKDSKGIRTREDAIQFYIDKGVSLYFDDSMNLTSFDCSRPGGLTDDDMKYIVFFPEAGAIHLSDKTITDDVFYYFQDLNNITALSLYNTAVSGEGFRYLLEKRKLIIFDFGGSPVTDIGLKFISQINFENNVIILNLKGSEITDEGMKYIKKIRFGKGRINLRHTSVTDAGIIHLAGFKELIEVDLLYTEVTDRGGTWLQKQIPGANITWGVLSPIESQ